MQGFCGHGARLDVVDARPGLSLLEPDVPRDAPPSIATEAFAAAAELEATRRALLDAHEHRELAWVRAFPDEWRARLSASWEAELAQTAAELGGLDR